MNNQILPRSAPNTAITHQRITANLQGPSLDEIKRTIREMNLKVTSQRVSILTALHEGGKHVTAQELFEIVNRKHPEIGFATVYRFLRDLADYKVVTEVRMGGSPARYELAPQAHHDHLSCTRCGIICEFENKSIEKLQEQVATHFGFILTNHILELYGLCPSCQKLESNPSVVSV